MMKNSKRLTAVCLTLCMMAGSIAFVSATSNWQEFFWNFNSLTVGTEPARYHPFEGTTLNSDNGGVTGMTAKIAEDPENSENMVIEYVNTANSLTPRMEIPFAKLRGLNQIFSVNLYAPSTSNGVSIEITDGGYSGALYEDNAGYPNATSFGRSLVYPSGHEKSGQNYTMPKEQWVEVAVRIDNSTLGTIKAAVWIDGVCMLPLTTVANTDFLSSAFGHKYQIRGKSTIILVDDLECRVSNLTLAQDVNLSVTSAHTGTGVDVYNTTFNASFNGGSERIVDPATYTGNITVTAGGIALSEGTDYNVLYNNTKDVSIVFANRLLYSTAYNVAFGPGIKALIGTDITQASFDFITQAKPADAENDNPVVTLRDITDNIRYDIGENITFTVNATDDDGISKVDIYADGNLVQTMTTAPYNASFTLVEGVHSVYAVATDASDEELTGVSSSINVIVKENMPTELTLSPGNGFVLPFTGIQNFAAHAYDPDGEALSEIELYIDDVLVGKGSYSGTIQAPGEYTFKAVVYDSRNNEYSKEVSFTYLPEFQSGWMTASFDFSDSSRPSSIIGNATYEQFDEEHGSSLVYTSSSSQEEGVKQGFEDWAATWHDAALITYDFLVEDVSAQKVNFPSFVTVNGEEAINIAIIGGSITDLDSGKVYGTIQPDIWYEVKVLADSVRGLVIIEMGGIQIVKQTGFKGTIRPIKSFLYETIQNAPDGQRMFIDNYSSNYIYKLPSVEKIEAVSSDGSISTGERILPSTTSFNVVLYNYTKSWCFSNNLFKLYKNGVEVACTVAPGGTMVTLAGSNSYLYAVVTPAEQPLEVGQTYTISVLPGIQGIVKNKTGSLYSSDYKDSVCRYSFDKTVSAQDFYMDDAAIYEGDTPVETISQVQGNTVKFALKATNINQSEKPITLIIAAYKGNTLKSVSVTNETIAANADKQMIETDVVDITGCDSVRGFRWHDVDGLVPYGMAIVIN